MTVYTATGATIARGNGDSPEQFQPIKQVTNIDPVGQTRALIDVTNLSSPAREYKKAIKDGQEISVQFQYDPDDQVHSGLRDDLDSENARNFRITLTNSPAEMITFAALVTNWSLTGISVDNVMVTQLTLKPTGDLQWT